MHSCIVSVSAVLLVSALALAQFGEFGESCTTLQCRRDSFLMQEHEKLSEIQLDLMEMLFEIQTLNEQEAYIMGYHGAAMQQPYMQQRPLS